MKQLVCSVLEKNQLDQMKDQHVSLPKPKSQLTQLCDDDEDVFATNLIDRYAARPLSLQTYA